MNKNPQKVYNGIEDDAHLSLPIPRRDLISNRYMKVPTVIANRGCSNRCVMAGFDYDTRESLLHTVEMMDEIGIDMPRYSILTPFPGTKLYDNLDKAGRLITKDWNLYDTMHVVFKPKQMTKEVLQTTFYDMWKRSYGLGRIIKRVNNIKKNG